MAQQKQLIPGDTNLYTATECDDTFIKNSGENTVRDFKLNGDVNINGTLTLEPPNSNIVSESNSTKVAPLNIIANYTGYGTGAQISLYPPDRINDAGCFIISAKNSAQVSKLKGQPDGVLTWNNKNIALSVNGIEADANGNIITDFITSKQLDDKLAAAPVIDTTPVGTIIAFAGDTPPPGYLLCDGSAYGIADYPDLYKVIGTKYGVGGGMYSPIYGYRFNVPNLIGRFIEGGITPNHSFGNSYPKVGTVIPAGLPNITGTFGGSSMTDGGTGAFTQIASGYAHSDGAHERAVAYQFNASLSNSIYGGSNTVQPPAVVLLYCIKY